MGLLGRSPGSSVAAALWSARALAVTLAVAVAVTALGASVALGVEPSASPAELLSGGDPRSEGEGPGLVGSPLLILAGVVALGFATALVTIVVVRLGSRR